MSDMMPPGERQASDSAASGFVLLGGETFIEIKKRNPAGRILKCRFGKNKNLRNGI